MTTKRKTMQRMGPCTDELRALLADIVAGVQRHQSTGFPSLDEIFGGGWQKGSLNIIAGRPAMGKTALALELILQALVLGSVIMYSLEMSTIELMKRLLSRLAEVPLLDIRKARDGDPSTIRMIETCNVMASLPLLVDDDGLQTAEQLHKKTVLAQKALTTLELPPLALVVVDYLQLISGKGQNRTAEISEITRTLKLLAKETGVPVVALSQLNRAVENRQDKRPSLADLRESGSIEQDADTVTMIYRDEYYNRETVEPGIAELNVVKNRHGPVGTARCHFVGELVLFRDVRKQRHAQNDQR